MINIDVTGKKVIYQYGVYIWQHDVNDAQCRYIYFSFA